MILTALIPSSAKACSRALVLALAGTVLLAAACGGNTQSKTLEGGAVTVRANGIFGSFDPTQPGIGGTGQVNNAVYDTLLAFHQGKVVGSLAKSWTSAPTSVTVTLKQGAKCADGNPLTPGVVVASFNHLLAKSPFVTRLFNQSTVSFAGNDSTNTITLTLAKPFNEALYGLAANYSGIVCPAGLAPGADYLKNTYGSGEYTLASVSPDLAVLKLRKEWNWGPFGVTGSDPGVPDTINVKVVTDETTAANLLITGGIDIATVNGPDNTRLQATKSLAHRRAVVYNPWLLQMNEAPGRPTADPQVRKAIMESVDQKGWNQAALAGSGVTSPSILGTNQLCYEDTSKLLPPASTAAARATLSAAGYTGSPTGPLSKAGKPLTLQVIATPQQGQGGEYLVSQFIQAGFDAKLTNLDSLSFSKAFLSGNYDVDVGYYTSAGANPGTNIAFFYGSPPPNGTNLDSINDPVLESAIQRALTTTESDRCAAWRVVQERMLAGYHLLPVAAAAAQWYSHPSWSYFASSQTLEIRALVRTA